MSAETMLSNEAAKAAVQQALERVRTVQVKGAVFLERSADRIGCTLILDSDTDAVGAQIIVDEGYVWGDRILCLSYPPAGLVVIGKRGGGYEDWLNVGDGDNPQFENDWEAFTGTTDVDQDAAMIPSFKKTGSRTELRGRAHNTTGATNPSTIFVLPEAYAPRNDLTVPCLVGPIVGGGACIILRDGRVRAFTYSGSVDEADGGYICLDGISFTSD
jgi:hypothetical protein